MKKLLPCLLFALLIFAPSAQAQKEGKSWVFKHKINAVTKAIEQGRPITVKWRGLGGMRSSTGRLTDITTDSTVLEMKGGVRGSIPNDRITDIRAKSKSNVFVRMLAGALIYIGVLLFGIPAILLLTTIVKADENFPWGQFMLSAFSLLLGTLILVGQPKATVVREPFGADWTIETVPLLPAKKNTP